MGDAGVEKVGIVVAKGGEILALADGILLDAPARTSDTHGVFGRTIPFDEPVLDHHHRLFGKIQVVVRTGHRARRMGYCIAFSKNIVIENVPDRAPPLLVPDGHASLELVDQFPVPGGQIPGGVVQFVRRGEHGNCVNESVDGASFDTDDVVHGQAVRGRGLCQSSGRSWVMSRE